MLIGDCNGCEACILVCQQGAIVRGRRLLGRTYKAVTDNLSLYTGELIPGATAIPSGRPERAQVAQII